MKIKLGALAVISGAVMFSLALPAFGQYYRIVYRTSGTQQR